MFLNIFVTFWEKLDEWLSNFLWLDDLFNGLVDFYFGMHSVFRILIFIFLTILLVLGVIAFIKKLFKLFIVITIIFVLYLIFGR